MTDTAMPFIPEFSEYRERNAWIKRNADYWTVFRRKQRSCEREECPTYDEAVHRAQELIRRDPNARYLIYAVHQLHDTLAATVSRDGVKEHD